MDIIGIRVGERPEDKKMWHYGEEPLPFTDYNFGNLLITDEELLGRLSKAPKGKFLSEADVRPMGAAVSDKKYDRPANPAMSILAEVNTGMILSCDMNAPGEDAIVGLAESVIGIILKAGAPKEIGDDFLQRWLQAGGEIGAKRCPEQLK